MDQYTPQTEEIGLQIITTAVGVRTSYNYDCQNFQQVFTGVPFRIKPVVSGVPKISNKFSRE